MYNGGDLVQTKSLIRRTAFAAGLVWSVAIALLGLQLPGLAAKALNFVPLAFVGLFWLFDKYLWHWSWVVRFVGRPDLRGTWVGHFDGEWITDDGTRNRTMGPTALVVSQTFTTLAVTLVAEKSKSYSYLAQVRKLESGEFRIDYDYTNKPFVHHRHTMPEHNGTAQLTVAGIRSNSLQGEYWTSRLSRGTLSAIWRSPDRRSDLKGGQSLAQKSRKEIIQ